MKTILKSLAAIVAVGAIAGGATFAYFSDTESVDGNKITAGTLDLVIDEQTNIPVVIENAYPGQETSKTVRFKNAGSIQGHLTLDFGGNLINSENGMNDPEREVDDTYNDGGPNGGELCENLEVMIEAREQGQGTFTEIYGYDNTILDFEGANVNLPGNRFADIRVTTKVMIGAGNEIQSDICGADFIVGLIQDVDGDGIGDDTDTDF